MRTLFLGPQGDICSLSSGCSPQQLCEVAWTETQILTQISAFINYFISLLHSCCTGIMRTSGILTACCGHAHKMATIDKIAAEDNMVGHINLWKSKLINLNQKHNCHVCIISFVQ